MATKLWTLHFMRICLANLLLFMSLYLLYPVLPVMMASRLGVPVSQTGVIFILLRLQCFLSARSMPIWSMFTSGNIYVCFRLG